MTNQTLSAKVIAGIAGQPQWFVHLAAGAPEGLALVTCQYLKTGKR